MNLTKDLETILLEAHNMGMNEDHARFYTTIKLIENGYRLDSDNKSDTSKPQFSVKDIDETIHTLTQANRIAFKE